MNSPEPANLRPQRINTTALSLGLLAVIGVGASKRLSAVRWGVAGRLVVAWVLTIPASAIVAALCYWALEMVGLAA